MSKQSRARAAAEATSRALPSDQPNPFLARWGTFLAGVVVVLAALAAYHNSFSGPFVFDDTRAITDNLTIRHLGSALVPPSFVGATTAGRPVINLTFALNYALNGTQVWGYHAFNLLVHALAGLVLFGIVRRTLECGRGALTPHLSRSRGEGTPPTVLAMAVAVIWIVHPLQTEAVTYISQRAESLMGLFYLLTLYGFVRSTDETGERPGDRQSRAKSRELRVESGHSVIRPLASSLWSLASICSCLLGMACKEVMVSAPVMVLLYDRTFVAGSLREAWRLRWRYYLGLACTWLLLARLMIGLGQRSVGFDQGVTWWSYALTSCQSVVLYCKMTLWPHPLVFDYGAHFIRHATEAVPYALILAALLVGTMMALRRWPAIGFLGAWFLVILAPTSSVVPVALQPTAEHRMYLSLAAVVVLGVLGLHRLIGRRGLMVCAAAAAGLGWLSVQRNKDYRSELTLWSDTVIKCPNNARAHDNLGNALFKMPGRLSEAITQLETAVRLDPGSAKAHTNLGTALQDVPGRLPDAIAEFKTAVRLDPGMAEAHNNLGSALLDLPGRLPDAIAEFETALQLGPDLVEAHNNLGTALLKMPGRVSDAITQFEEALRISPDSMEAHSNLGRALLKAPGRSADALAEFETAVRLNPDSAEMHYNLGNALLTVPDRLPDAIVEYETALRINPDSAETHLNLGTALLSLPGRQSDAIAQFETAVRINPDSADAHLNLGNVLLNLPERVSDAVAQFEAAVRINPDSAEAHDNLGTALLRVPGRVPDAIAEYGTALRLNPNSAGTHYNLGNALLRVPGRLPDAIAQYEASLRIDPDSVEAHYNLGNALLNLPGRQPDAIAQLQAALRLNPDLTAARDLLNQLQNPNGLEDAAPMDSSLHSNDTH
jgi:tetratricopeptide (TPR) repeat protein